MSSSAAKKDDDQNSEVVELSLSTDREQGLSQNFDDPVLEDLIPGLVQSGEPSAALNLVQETAEAVQELVTEVQAETPAMDLSQNFGDLNLQPTEAFDPDPTPQAPLAGEPAAMFVMDGNLSEEGAAAAKWEMAEKLFQLVACERKFEDLVEISLSALIQALGAQAGAVLELDHANQSYFFRASIGGGDPEKVKAFRVPFHKGIVGHVGESKQAILVRDMSQDEMQMRAISMSVGFEAKTCMAAPILIGGRIYGVIEIFNRKDGALFEQRDLETLEAGARLTAKVLEVRFLMAELLKRAG